MDGIKSLNTKFIYYLSLCPFTAIGAYLIKAFFSFFQPKEQWLYIFDILFYALFLFGHFIIFLILFFKNRKNFPPYDKIFYPLTFLYIAVAAFCAFTNIYKTPMAVNPSFFIVIIPAGFIVFKICKNKNPNKNKSYDKEYIEFQIKSFYNFFLFLFSLLLFILSIVLLGAVSLEYEIPFKILFLYLTVAINIFIWPFYPFIEKYGQKRNLIFYLINYGILNLVLICSYYYFITLSSNEPIELTIIFDYLFFYFVLFFIGELLIKNIYKFQKIKKTD